MLYVSDTAPPAPMDLKHAPQCLFPGPVEASDSTTMPDTEVTCADAEPKKESSENVALIIAVQTEESHDRAWYRHTVANRKFRIDFFVVVVVIKHVLFVSACTIIT